MKILLAIDGSACSEAAVEAVARRPWPADSEVKIISVVEMPQFPGREPWTLPAGYFEQFESTMQDRLRATVNQAVSRIRGQDGDQLKVMGQVLMIGEPKEVILEEAESWGADLIVVGSHGVKGWKRLWLGSVSQAVATDAKCSVEIVRCSKRSDNQQ